MAFLANYEYRKKITIDATKIASNLTDFPVLVKLDINNFDFIKAESDGIDIRFTEYDGSTLLKFERERHDNILEEAEYHVKIPSISGGGAVSFDGSGDYLTIANHSDFNFGNGDFTIETWFRPNAFIFGNFFAHTTAQGPWQFYITVNKEFSIYGATGTVIESGAQSLNIGEWYHIAYVRSGNDWEIFLDGTSIATATLTRSVGVPAGGNGIKIGAETTAPSQFFNGDMDEFRVLKGVAQYTSNFTLSTVPFTSDVNTKLLLHFSDNYIDSGNTGHTITPAGNTDLTDGYFATDTDFYIYYGYPSAVDGEDAINVWDSDFLAVYHMNDLTTSTIKDSTSNANNGTKSSANNPDEVDGLIYKAQNLSEDSIILGDIDINGDGTLEAIINPDSFVSTFNTQIISKGNTDGNGFSADISLSLEDTTGEVSILVGDGISSAQTFTSTLTTSITSWQYIAGKADGTDLTCFLDTVKQTTSQTVTPAGTSDNYRIGRFGDFSSGGTQFDGKIGEVRISSIARSDTWLKVTRETLFDNLLTFGSEEEGALFSSSETIFITDDVTIQVDTSKTDQVIISDEIQVTTALGQSLVDGITISDEIQVDKDYSAERSEGIKIQEDLLINLEEEDLDQILISDDIIVSTQITLDLNETIELGDTIDLQKTDVIDINETLNIGESYYVNIAQEFEEAIETLKITETSDIHLIATISYASKIISYNPLIIVTDTDPIQIAKFDVSDPENPTWSSYFINDVGETAKNAKSVVYNSTFNEIYIACADGQVVIASLDDLDIREQVDTGDLDTLTHIETFPETRSIYASTDEATGEVLAIEEFDVAKLNTDFQFLEKIETKVDTTFDTVDVRKIDTDFQFLAITPVKLNTDLRFLYVDTTPDASPTPSNDPYTDVAFFPIKRTDFEVKIDSVSMTDVKLDSITVYHSVDEKSQASFILARKHDDLDTGGEITNQNVVEVYIQGLLEFTGKVANITANSEAETVEVTAQGVEQETNSDMVVLPLPSINEKLHPYQVIVETPTIYNPFIDPDEENPEFYKGVKVDLGNKVEQNYSLTANISQDGFSSVAEKLMNGNFLPLQNHTYFWNSVRAHNPFTGFENTIDYIGTSMSPMTADAWNLIDALYWRQREFADIETELGEYTIGEAPFKNVSVKNGILISDYHMEDRADGLYKGVEEGYNYVGQGDVKGYAQRVADLEYEKLKGSHGEVLPQTSIDIDVMIDGYYYYNLSLLTRVNITNTTTTDIYNENNGFPTSIKSIEISSADMMVHLRTDNSLSRGEMEEIEDQFPDDEDEEFLTEESMKKFLNKFDPNANKEVE